MINKEIHVHLVFIAVGDLIAHCNFLIRIVRLLLSGV